MIVDPGVAVDTFAALLIDSVATVTVLVQRGSVDPVAQLLPGAAVVRCR